MQAALKIDSRECLRESVCDFCGAAGVVGLERDGVTICVACLGEQVSDADEQSRHDELADGNAARAEYERSAMVRP